MAIGFGLLRLSPQAFWAMTPVEFERATRVLRPHRALPPRRGELVALMRDFPDAIRMEAGFG